MSETKENYNVNSLVDIHKIIDDAMEKKDRYVTIFINGDRKASVYIKPLEDDDPRWIRDEEAGLYFCSE